MTHRAAVSVLALAAALAAPTAWAADSDPTVLEAVIVTASAEDARTVGGSATFLDDDALEVFGHADVNQVLRQVPGVFLQEEDGFGLRPNIGIRGSGTDRSGRVAVMEDGVLIAPAPYAAPAAYYFPRLARMTGVEVTKGPGAIKYGPLTTGGAINLFSTPIPEAAAGELELLGGTDGALRAHGWAGGWAPLGQGLEIGGLIEGLREESDGFKALDNGGPTGFGIDDLVFKLALRTGPGAALPQSLELKHQTYDETSHETYLGLTLADFGDDPFRRYNGSQADRMDVAHDTWQLTHRIALSSALDLTTVAYRTDTTRAWYKLNDVRNSAGTGWVGISAVLADPAAYADQMAVLVGADGFTSADGACGCATTTAPMRRKASRRS
ncbi:TonB-dependent receptor family protein [Brevundimonas denitrificans]|uniref:TonB-dependent receptor family protein n=1 Tax=Brevundimonas denitrificans TaxID=1443434 RepID=UPI00223AACB4|nr:TonB-dependent receptor plug domain-containing protein [Brevundimonas denitrificans]